MEDQSIDRLKKPYRGLMPYAEEDAQFFFGREKERKIIIDNLKCSRLTLLYGSSGVGKSSVLRAGVAYHFQQEAKQNLEYYGTPIFAIVVFNSWRDDPLDELINSVQESVAQAIEPIIDGLTICVQDHIKHQRFHILRKVLLCAPHSEKVSFLLQFFGFFPPKLTQTLQTWSELLSGENVSLTLPQTLQKWAELLSSEDVRGKLFIILDQFEEYFLYHQDEDEEGTFAVEFPRAVNCPDLPVNFLISIREDSLDKLDHFKGRIPNLFYNFLRLKHLDAKSAHEAIVKPIEKYNELVRSEQPISIEPDLAKVVIDQVSQVVTEGNGRGGLERLRPQLDKQIQTPYLQLVMTRLWEKEMNAGSRCLQLKTFLDLGDAKQIVRDHINEKIESLKGDEKKAAANVFQYLVTPSGNKIAYPLLDLVEPTQLSKTQLKNFLQKLSSGSQRILRSVGSSPSKPDVELYEIFHDVLAQPILDWRKKYFLSQEKQYSDWLKQIRKSLYESNSASLAQVPSTYHDLILGEFCKEFDFLSLIINKDTATLEVSELEIINGFSKAWRQAKVAMRQHNISKFRNETDRLTHFLCKTLNFKLLEQNSVTPGQFYGRMIDASNPAFQLNIRPSFPLIFACKKVFGEEDAWKISGLLNNFGMKADYFALLVIFDNYQEIRQQVRESPYKNDFIVLNHNQLWDILAAKSPIQQLINCILEQIDLVAISPYTVFGPVNEKMFFGRAEEEKTLLQNIERNDYALLANRKTGKTSLLNKISPRLKAIPDFQVFNCDLQAVYDYESFFGELAISYPEFEEEIIRLSEPSPLGFRKVMSNIKQRNSNRQIIFLFDEVDELLAYDIQEKEKLFKTFRTLSQRENIRFIFTGTTTLVRRVSDPDSPFFNFCDLIKLELLEEKAARELVTVPMKTLGVKFDNEAEIVQRILDLTARHPNIIQYICGSLIKIINEKQKRTITEQDLDSVVTSQEFYEYFESLIWVQSTALEKLIVYAMWSYPEFTELEVMEEFKRRGIPVEGVKASLEILLTYSTLSKKDTKYFFTFREFAKLMEKRSDIQALAKKYQQELEGVES